MGLVLVSKIPESDLPWIYIWIQTSHIASILTQSEPKVYIQTSHGFGKFRSGSHLNDLSASIRIFILHFSVNTPWRVLARMKGKSHLMTHQWETNRRRSSVEVCLRKLKQSEKWKQLKGINNCTGFIIGLILLSFTRSEMKSNST